MTPKHSGSEYLVATVRLHLVHDGEQNARITNACNQQRAIHNRTLEHLLTHRSDEPLQTSKAKGVIGIFGRLKAWRRELGEIPSLIARGGASAAHDQVQKWEAANLRHAVLVARAAEDGTDIPRSVQRRTPREQHLYRSRKQEDRQGRNRCRIDECVRRIDRRTLHVPGIGRLTTKDDIPENLDIRSCIILERTPKPRLSGRIKPEDRSYKIHVTGRLPKPALKSPDGPGRTVGIDHGVVHAVTTADAADETTTFDQDLAAARRAQKHLRKLAKKRSRCRRHSRKWNARKLEAKRQGRSSTTGADTAGERSPTGSFTSTTPSPSRSSRRATCSGAPAGPRRSPAPT